MVATALSLMSVAILLAAQVRYAAASAPLSLFATDFNLNITETNCRGSIWCPKFNFASNRINLYLQDWVNYSMSDSDMYGPGAQIACATVSVLLPPLGTNAYCAFTEGVNVPAAGINGSMVKRKMEELRLHGCFACGSVAIADSGNPVEKGVIKIDFVRGNKLRCGGAGQVICPPTVPGAQRVGLEQGSKPALSTVTATFDEGAVSLQAFNIQDS